MAKEHAKEPLEETPGDDEVEHLLTLGGVLEFLADRLMADRVVLITDSARVVGEIVSDCTLPIVFATTKEDLKKDYASDCETVLQLAGPLPKSLEMLEDVRSILVSAYLEGSLKDNEDTLVISASEDQPLMLLNFNVAKDPSFNLLKTGIGERVDLSVFEMLFRIAGDLVRQGREGKTVGALFLIGDPEPMLEASRQVVINPFQGHEREERFVLDAANIETIKEYALLDGAIVVSGDGYLEAAGRYVLLEQDAELASGLGGRHLAAASITKKTKAVAIVVSSSGVIRVYMDGQPIMELDGH
ncbi:MAG: DNA integrity scanning protein DisA nucleotide-binding domain protein [Candidatus Thermoplasmatota archaeon]|nr:DNA integrity scanning protein DisA nucleotide-binding domain protein [Candidatus Thermoplasmatota archaeon]